MIAFSQSTLIAYPEVNEWHYDVVACTTTFRRVIDQLFAVTLEVEKNLWNAQPDVFVDMLKPIDAMVGVCTNNVIGAARYEDCVRRIESVLPSIGKLVEAIDVKSTKEIIMDSTEIGLELLNGVSYCMDL